MNRKGFIKAACLICLLWPGLLVGQAVVITNSQDYTQGHASAVLDIWSENTGLLIPRMGVAARETITLPARGLLVFQTDEPAGFYYNAGTPEEPAWVMLGGGASGQPDTRDVFDADGNVYPVISLGALSWMARNLNVTRLSSGQPLVRTFGGFDWIQAVDGAFACYDLDASLSGVLGSLYNGHAASDPAGLCPVGWRLPTTAEWEGLQSMVSQMEQSVNALMSGLYWDPAPGMFPNTSGFSAHPSGARDPDTGSFHGFRQYAFWWATEPESGQLKGVKLDAAGFSIIQADLRAGFSVRCVQPNP